MTQLANGLSANGYPDQALQIYRAKYDLDSRLDTDEQNMLITRGNIANCFFLQGQYAEGVAERRKIYERHVVLSGIEDKDTLREALNLATNLMTCRRFDEARSLLREPSNVAVRALGADNELTLRIRNQYAMMIHVSQSKDSPGARKLCAEAVEIVADVHKRVKRIYGKFPDWILEENLGALRERMAKWADE